jgi:centrosomal protein CEP76
VYKPSNSLIDPISVGRAINTPYEAARFVSLIPFERRENPGGEKVEIWQSAHTFLTLGKGDVEDHAILLCNLLLGFGLDAFVAVGISINGPHLWVLTRSKIDNKKYSTTFWESLTGQRVTVEDPKVFRFYKRIHCVFNDTKFYANIQIDDTVFNTIYNLEDEFLWKTVPTDKITSLSKYSFAPILDIITVDKYKMEVDIEREIKSKIAKFRKSKNNNN